MRRKKKIDARVGEAQKWFRKSVSYEGEPYIMDAEQVAAVVDESWNAIVVARAGSGKTRTIVAKIVYLIARQGVKPEEIMAFVFNANAAREINERLMKMRVDGEPVMNEKVKIAVTFHAFARKIVYEACGGKEKCGKILAGEKEEFVLAIVKRMMREAEWRDRILQFMGKTVVDEVGLAGERGKVVADDMSGKELGRFAVMMAQFINRAQQKYLGGEVALKDVVKEYLNSRKIDARERRFVELGLECYRRYHWYLLDAKKKLAGFGEYGTDFNLIVSWASKLIRAERGVTKKWLGEKKHILIDEYQDFSQLFLAAVEAVREVAKDARLFVVGDDWQAINRFAGSEVEYFKNFERYFKEDCRRYEITTNYRCDREIVDTARKFMKKAMGEKGEFRAWSRRMGKVVLVDPLLTMCGYTFVGYDKRMIEQDKIFVKVTRKMTRRDPKLPTVRYVKTLAEIICKNWRAKEILLLHRNNEMNMEGISLARLSSGLRWLLAELGVMSAEEYDAKVRVMTMHKSKGLEAEVVTILEADAGIIPKTHPDTRLYGVFGETDEVALDDQKRLFYVAMTRAKKRLYIMHERVGERELDGFIPYLGKGMEKWGE